MEGVWRMAFGNKSSDSSVKDGVETMKTIRVGLVSLAFIIFAVMIIIVAMLINKNAEVKKLEEEMKKEPVVTASMIEQQLVNCSELTAAELNYRGVIRVEKGQIPIIDKNSFFMIYNAKVKAGIDIADAKIDVSEKEVVVTLPETEVLSIDIDPSSIEMYDEKQSIFNPSGKQDAIDAMNFAIEDVNKNADLGELKNRAELQTRAIIQGVLEPTLGGRTLVIKYDSSLNGDTESTEGDSTEAVDSTEKTE